ELDLAGGGDHLTGDHATVLAAQDIVGQCGHAMPSADGFVDGHQLGAVGEGGFDLNVVDHLRNPLHHLVAGDDVCPGFHQLGHGAAVAGALDHEIGDERDSLGVVELDAALEAL